MWKCEEFDLGLILSERATYSQFHDETELCYTVLLH